MTVFEAERARKKLNARKAAVDVFYELAMGVPEREVEIKVTNTGIYFRFQNQGIVYGIICSPYWETIEFCGEEVDRETLVKKLHEAIEL